LPAGEERCASCGANVAPPTQGALAPDPARVEPLREIPGLKKRERTWKDEVRERVRDRRRQRSSGELPLFDDADDSETELPEEPEASAPPAAGTDRSSPEPDLRWQLDSEAAPEEPDLPLRGPEPTPRAEPAPGAPRPELRLAPARKVAEEPPDVPDRWAIGEDIGASSAPVERPAYPGERFSAALIDLAVLAPLWAAIVYFASRAARVPLSGLLPAWPYLVGYMALLGLVYATIFTSSTGQTVGKIVTGLRVVDVEGRPPDAARSALRALLGGAGVLLAGLGMVPIFVDPARRAAHDRLLRTRVIRG
jgi:uncharacterized RDD family membrane protein YckC